MEAAARYYSARLLGGEEGLSYLERRGLRDVEMIERFLIGYSDRSLGPLVPEKNRTAGARIRVEAVMTSPRCC